MLKSLLRTMLMVILPCTALAKPIVYFTDGEGSRTRLEHFFASEDAFELGADGKYHLKPGHIFVFGGDAFDRFAGDLWIAEELVRLKREPTADVFIIIGNRDLNKLRFLVELSDAAMQRPPIWFPFISEDVWRNKQVGTRAQRLQFILAHTMGAPKAFELRRADLAALLEKDITLVSDDDVAQSFYDSVNGNGIVLEMLKLGQLVARVGNNLFLHSEITKENLGFVPSDPQHYSSIDVWTTKLNNWYQKHLNFLVDHRNDWNGTGLRPSEELLEYPMPRQGRDRKQESVITGRNSGKYNNPQFPPADMIDALLKQGINRVVHGHTPVGPFPVTIRTLDRQFEMIDADNSYNFNETQASVVKLSSTKNNEHYDKVDIHGFAEFAGRVEQLHASWRLGDTSSFGLASPDHSLVMAALKSAPDTLVSFKMIEGYKIENKLMPAEQVSKQLKQAPHYTPDKILLDNIAFFPGSFDPPTLAHRAMVSYLLNVLKMDKVFIVVNIAGPKDYDTAAVERVDLLKIMLDEFGERVEIRGEPFAGKEAFYQKLQTAAPFKVFNVVGEDGFGLVPKWVDRDRPWIYFKRPNGQVHTPAEAANLPRGSIEVDLPEMQGVSSSKVREDLYGTDAPITGMDFLVLNWIFARDLYSYPENIKLRQSEFTEKFAEFQKEVSERLARFVTRPTILPAFKPTQSRGAWLDKFIEATIQSNEMKEQQGQEFADLARALFLQKEWREKFPLQRLKEGSPSTSCRRAIAGGI